MSTNVVVLLLIEERNTWRRRLCTTSYCCGNSEVCGAQRGLYGVLQQPKRELARKVIFDLEDQQLLNRERTGWYFFYHFEPNGSDPLEFHQRRSFVNGLPI